MLALIQVVIHEVQLGQADEGDVVVRMKLERLLVAPNGSIKVALRDRLIRHLVADLKNN